MTEHYDIDSATVDGIGPVEHTDAGGVPLDPEEEALVDEAVARLRLAQAVGDPVAYWERRAHDAEAAVAEARATKDMHKERAEEMEATYHEVVVRLGLAQAALARVQHILAADYYNPAKALRDIRQALQGVL